MKNLFPILGFFAILCWSSCETDFELEGDWKDIPVIYSFLSEQDTAYYVRVERAFLEPGGNAVEIAQIPDSIYYGANEVTVTMTVGNDTEELVRVVGSDEGYAREDGPFVSSPNYLYKLRRNAMTLEGGDDFRVTIARDGEITAEASSTVVSEMEFDNLPPNGLTLDDFNRTNTVVWRPSGDQVAIFDVRVIVEYSEPDPNNPGGQVAKEIVWLLDKDMKREPNVSTQRFRFDNEAFYQFVGGELEPLANGNRRLLGVYYEVTGAGEEIAEYLAISNANIGITSSQAIPVYSNVDGGVGIVSSRYSIRSVDLGLNSPSRDSLYNGSYTGDLNFVP